jgi:uncharacterized membrane protein YraQ (UPF0718 family)
MSRYIIIAVAAVALVVSAFTDRKRTGNALTIAGRRLLSLLPSFFAMLAVVSIVLTVIREGTIARTLGGGGNLFVASLVAAAFGSVTLMPGFIAFPLAGILLEKGVALMVLAAFTTTLMMVGVVTYPIEKRYFGPRVTIVRNLLSLLTACVVALAIGLYFGEVPA